MAFQNILQGKFTGKLGELSGSSWKGKAIVKSAPFSQKPHSNAQTQSVRAFECANRLCSGIAKAGFSKLGLSSKTMHPHNAVAKWLKPVVKNHIFEPNNISEIIPRSNNFLVTGFTYNKSSGKMFIDIRKSHLYTSKDFENLFIIVFNDIGSCFFTLCIPSHNFSTLFTLDPSHNFVYSIILFTTYPKGNKYISENFFYKRGTGMKYSLEEQPTGDIWLDGRPIYQRTFNFTVTVGNSLQDFSITFNINDTIHPLDAKFSIPTASSIPLSFAGQILDRSTLPDGYSSNIFSFNFDNQYKRVTFQIYSLQGNQIIYINGRTCYATIYYTKPSDQPVVDG